MTNTSLTRTLVLTAFVAVFALPTMTRAANVNLSDFGNSYAGAVASAFIGGTMATGDINNDGFTDVLIGAPNENSNRGAIYIFYGDGPTHTEIDLSTFDAKLTGESVNDYAGYSLAIGDVYDVDEDNGKEIIIGAPGDDDAAVDAGAVYVLPQQATVPLSGTQTLGALGMKLTGIIADDAAGEAVAVGDIFAGGYDELIVGVPGEDTPDEDAGVVVVLEGDNFTSGSLATESAATLLGGSEFARAGGALAVGAVTGPELSIIIGAAYDSQAISTAGSVTVISSAGLVAGQDPTDFFTAGGFAMGGAEAGDRAGSTIVAADLNGDGFDDLLIDAPNAETNGEDSGSVFVVLGSSTLTGPFGLEDADAIFLGSTNEERLGQSMSAGDVNGDSYTDVILSGTGTVGTPDAAYVVLGSSTIASRDLATESADITFTAYADNQSGTTVRLADLNNDGFDDVLLSAPYDDTGAVNGGIVYAGLLYADDDSDGTPGDTGSLDGTDCDDTEADVTETTTFYPDSDEDGLGDADAGSTLCLATPPAGYVADDSDTSDNDHDNDGTITPDDCDDADSDVTEDITYYADTDDDGLGDPENTTALCSATAPEGYVANASDFVGEEEPATDDPEAFSANIESFDGTTAGQILVHYTNDTTETYTIFDTPDATTETKVEQYDDTGYLIVLHPKGKKLALVNVYTGEVLSKVKISSKKFKNRSLKIKDVREDGSLEAIVTMKKGKTKKSGRVVIVKVRTSSESLKKKDGANFESKKVRVKKTKKEENSVLLRNKNSNTILEYSVSSSYQLNSI
jgi:hypothetical protein